MKYWALLESQTPDTQWIIVDELIREVRLVKSTRELNAFRQAGEVVSGALTELMKSLISGQTEAEAAGNAARLVLRGGGHVHMLAISHGPYLNHLASDPLAGFSQERPSPGDLARAWITGPMFQGYWLGPGRTVVCGSPPTSAQRALLEANAEAVDAMVAAIRPGITVRELVAIGDRQRRRVAVPYSDAVLTGRRLALARAPGLESPAQRVAAPEGSHLPAAS
jgi:Xaa-Pro aminopeptidase